MNIAVRQIQFKSSNGSDLVFGWIYLPTEPIRAVVQISHGMMEHMGRYHELMRFLAQNGYAACGIDHLGHGRSARDEGHLGWFAERDGWRRLVEDQHTFNKIIRSEISGRPCVLLGHSMGSFIARLYAAKFPKSIAGLILCGTGRGGVKVDFGLAIATRSINKNGAFYRDRKIKKMVFGHYNDRFGGGNGGAWLSRNTMLVERYAQDTRCGVPFTASGYHDLFMLVKKSNERVCYEKTDPSQPVLLLSGTEDPVGEYGKGPAQVHERYIKAGVEDVQMRYYEGARHEVLGELNRDEVWSDLLAWLNEHFPTPVTAADAD